MSLLKLTEEKIHADYPNPLFIVFPGFNKNIPSQIPNNTVYDFLYWYFQKGRYATSYLSKGKNPRKQFTKVGANRSIIDLYRLCKNYVVEEVTLKDVIKSLNILIKKGIYVNKCYDINRIVFYGHINTYADRDYSLFNDDYVRKLTIAKGYPKLQDLIDEIEITER